MRRHKSAKIELPARMDYENMPRQQLDDLEDRLLKKDPDAVEQCVAFIEAESFATHHGRFRAKRCRRLKHREVSENQCERLVTAILKRFLSGRFSEQFKDQLQLVVYLDPVKVFEAAHLGLKSEQDHVRRYAEWILRREPWNFDAQKRV